MPETLKTHGNLEEYRCFHYEGSGPLKSTERAAFLEENSVCGNLSELSRTRKTLENTRESQVLRGPAALRDLPGTLRKHWGIFGFGETSGEPRSRGGGMASLRRSGKHWGILGFKATRCFASTAKLAIPPPPTDSFAGDTHRKHCGTLGFKGTRFSCVHRKLAIPPGGP